MLCHFVSTSTCELTFSIVNIVKEDTEIVTSALLFIVTRIVVTNYKYRMERVKVTAVLFLVITA